MVLRRRAAFALFALAALADLFALFALFALAAKAALQPLVLFFSSKANLIPANNKADIRGVSEACCVSEACRFRLTPPTIGCILL